MEKINKLSTEEKLECHKILKSQFLKIKPVERSKAFTNKNLRLYRRLLTGHKILGKKFLVKRTIQEMYLSPDSRLMKNALYLDPLEHVNGF